ncbi:MAG: glycosyltransferase [Nanoarchaeota archaeon]
MKVSVIVPAYNEEKYLAKTLKTLKEQTYRDYELIVVDNNSKDKTNQIAKKFADRVVVEKKKGYHNATNRGAKEARGEIICFCDADSLYPKDWLQKIMDDFRKNPDVVAVYGTCKFYDHNFIVNFISEPLYTMFIKLGKLFFNFHTTPGFNCAMKRKVYFQVGGYDAKIYNGINMDVELGKRLQKAGKLKQDTGITMFTSARRYKGDGLFKTTSYYLNAWMRFVRDKEQKMSYEQYNKEFR